MEPVDLLRLWRKFLESHRLNFKQHAYISVRQSIIPWIWVDKGGAMLSYFGHHQTHTLVLIIFPIVGVSPILMSAPHVPLKPTFIFESKLTRKSFDDHIFLFARSSYAYGMHMRFSWRDEPVLFGAKCLRGHELTDSVTYLALYIFVGVFSDIWILLLLLS